MYRCLSLIVCGVLLAAGCGGPSLSEDEASTLAEIHNSGGTIYKRVQVDPKQNFGVPTVLRATDKPAPDDDLVIHFEGDAASDATIAHLKTLKRLVGLQWKKTRLTDAGLKQLAAFSTLESLALLENQAVTDAGLVALSRLTRLKTLDLRGNFHPRAVARLRRSLPDCTIVVQ